MIDLKRLFQLIRKAREGVKVGCSVTTAAYLKMADQEILARIADGHGQIHEFASSAYVYISGEMATCEKDSQRIGLFSAFWRGFQDGQHNQVLSNQSGDVYQYGYEFGQFGERIQWFSDDEEEDKEDGA